jgi:dephospho-CoA kinase
LERRGLAVLDVDKLGHQAIIEEKQAIVSRFGKAILGPDGKVDRRILGAKVFGRPKELAAQEALVHPVVDRLTLRWLEEQGERPRVVNAALLHRSSAFGRLDAVILVKAPLVIRLVRAKKRDKFPWPALIRRFQSPQGFISRYRNKKNTGNVDGYVINNRGYGTFGSWILNNALERRTDQILTDEGIGSD